MHIGKPWPFFRLHYCGWDKDCQLGQGEWIWPDGTVYSQGPNRRINLGLGRHFMWIDLVHWGDRGRHSRSREDYRRLRRGLSR
jgi:hypothetical protein